MPRAGYVRKRVLAPDPVYSQALVTRVVNRIMKSGKKTIAQKNIYNALDILKTKTGKNAFEIFEQALENIKPLMEVRSRRIGGAAYQIPMTVSPDRRESLAIRWLIIAANARPSKEYHTFSEKLAAEILAALDKQGDAIKKRQDMERMAESNKAFAHFRW
jgi:small subunit ribosomal protein S7